MAVYFQTQTVVLRPMRIISFYDKFYGVYRKQMGTEYSKLTFLIHVLLLFHANKV